MGLIRPQVIPEGITTLSGDSNTGTLTDLTQRPNLGDLHSVAADIKSTLAAAIAELTIEVRAVTARVVEVEKTTAQHSAVLRHVHHKVDNHTLHLRDLHRQVEDLENRSRRHNLRIRGLPETVENDNLIQTVTSIFNNLLGRPPASAIKMERIHRALRPKGRSTDPPRDIICCLCDFQLKEEILRNAKLRSKCMYEGSLIQIYQDLSFITLLHRRDLKPLLEVLRNKNIIYRWKFPFGLLATNQGQSALLRVPEDLHPFCKTLDIPYMDVPDWYADFRSRPARKDNTRIDEMETIPTRFRRRRSLSTEKSPNSSKDQPSDLYSPGSSRSRKSRRGY